jgi:pimeloyl-ACP methyl ester carboxylesterase
MRRPYSALGRTTGSRPIASPAVPYFGSTNGVQVAAYDLGGDGPPVLFSHATGFHAHVWLPIVAELSSQFHCFGFDQRAHGDTRTPADIELAWDGIGDDALAAIDGLGLERAFGVGHSSGAAGLLLAEEARPGTFRALYGYEPVVLPMDPPPGPSNTNPLAEGATRRRDVFPSRDAAYDNYSSRGPFTALRADALRAYVDYGFEDIDEGDGGVRLKCRPENEAQMYRMGSAHHAFAGFPSITCPVTLVCGAETDAIGPAVIAAQAAPLRRVRTEELLELGHFGPLQDPAAVAASIARAFAGE